MKPRAYFVFTLLLFFSCIALGSRPGETAFGRVMLTNQQGQAQLLSQWMGAEGIVVLNFWASYCEPCRAEMPAMQTMMQDYPQARLLFINVDESSARAAADQMASSLDIKGQILYDLYQIAIRKYDQKMRVPTTVIIKDNRIMYQAHGYRKDTLARIKQGLERLK